MIRAALVFFAAFGVCAAIGTFASGCLARSDCDCPDVPPLPSALSARQISYAIVESDASPPLDLANGTLEINGAKVVFRYEQSGVNHQVVYKIYRKP
jgi:hypothetical protein